MNTIPPRRIALALMAIAAGLFCADTRAETSITLGGYYKNFSVVYAIPEYQQLLYGTSSTLLGQVTNRLRLNLDGRFGSHVRSQVSYNILPRVQDRVLFGRGIALVEVSPLLYRVADLDLRLYPAEEDPVSSFAIFQNLDRVSISASMGRFDLDVGRQAIAWGQARVINPTDVIAPFLYTELDTEDRIGVDAVRLRLATGMLSQIDAGYIAGEDFEWKQSAVYVRSTVNWRAQDITLLAMAFRQHALVGFDLARGIGGAGFWLETAYAWMDAFNDEVSGSGPNYLRLSIGLDYSFPGNLYGYIEYHFNGAGRTDADEYLSRVGSAPYTDAAVYLLGKHYLAPGVLYSITPLWTAGASLLVNLSDPSLLVSPTIEYNIAENIYLQGGAYWGLGKGTTASLAPPSIDFGSEFGAYADFYFFSFRFYF